MVEKSKSFAQIEKPRMPAIVEARAIFCAEPPDVARGETKAVWIPRRSRELAITPSFGKRLYYKLIKRIDADTLAGMRERLEQAQQRAKARRGINDELKARTAELRAASSGGDRGGVAPAGGRSDGTMAGGSGESRGHAIARPAER